MPGAEALVTGLRSCQNLALFSGGVVTTMNRIWIGLVLGMAALMAGCGGGGSGTETQIPPLASAVRISNVQPQKIEATVPEAETPMSGFDISADVLGDLSRLNGQTLYVLIEDASGLFDVASTLISPNGLGNRVSLKLKSTLGRGGVIEGNLRLNVCIDAACKQPLGNSPTLIPFKLQIQSGLKLLDASPLQVEVPFGTVTDDGAWANAVVRAVSLQVPVGFTGTPTVSWTSVTPALGGAPLASLTYGALQAGQTVPGRLAFGTLPVGRYAGQLRIRSLVANASVESESVTEVAYVVKASGKSMLFKPAVMDFLLGGAQGLFVVAADGSTYTQVSRIVYSANAGAARWLLLTPLGVGPSGSQFQVHAGDCSMGACGPGSGSYTASVYFATATGVEAPLPYTISLRVP